MHVAMEQQGGFLGLNRRIEIQDEKLTVIEGGRPRSVQRITVPARAKIHELVELVSKVEPLAIQRQKSFPSDDLRTVISFADGDVWTQIEVGSGDGAPQEVWDLIGAIEDYAEGATGA